MALKYISYLRRLFVQTNCYIPFAVTELEGLILL